MTSKYEEALFELRMFEREHNMRCFGSVVPHPYSDTIEELIYNYEKAQTYFIEAQKILNKDINNLLTENASLKKGIETLTIKNNLLQENCDSIADTNVLLSKGIENLTKENQELKDYIKALDKACEILDWDCPVSQELVDDLDCENCNDNYKECWKKYFLKEVLEWEK